MPTLESRITALEQQTPYEVFTAHQLATCTDDELLDILLTVPYSDGSHEDFIRHSEGLNHVKNCTENRTS